MSIKDVGNLVRITDKGVVSLPLLLRLESASSVVPPERMAGVSSELTQCCLN